MRCSDAPDDKLAECAMSPNGWFPVYWTSGNVATPSLAVAEIVPVRSPLPPAISSWTGQSAATQRLPFSSRTLTSTCILLPSSISLGALISSCAGTRSSGSSGGGPPSTGTPRPDSRPEPVATRNTSSKSNVCSVRPSKCARPSSTFAFVLPNNSTRVPSGFTAFTVTVGVASVRRLPSLSRNSTSTAKGLPRCTADSSGTTDTTIGSASSSSSASSSATDPASVTTKSSLGLRVIASGNVEGLSPSETAVTVNGSRRSYVTSSKRATPFTAVALSVPPRLPLPLASCSMMTGSASDTRLPSSSTILTSNTIGCPTFSFPVRGAPICNAEATSFMGQKSTASPPVKGTPGEGASPGDVAVSNSPSGASMTAIP
mmetsp:Transcript_69655/g.116057  ORF Transcript_69655/g.116057 Transcript_69655/m.116057 type:complete len:373 (+) Transcript_69655:2577-3695(+)